MTTASPRYDIAYRTGRYDDDGLWVDQRSRSADLYVFTWHSLTDITITDHRDPDQWQFFVLATSELPEQKTIALASLRALTDSVSIAHLAERVAAFTRRSPETRSA